MAISRIAARIAHAATEPTVTAPILPSGKNAAAVALGRLGGLKGGKARARTLSKSRRAEIAKRAAFARWSKLASE